LAYIALGSIDEKKYAPYVFISKLRIEKKIVSTTDKYEVGTLDVPRISNPSKKQPQLGVHHQQ